jgi:hypothetical protein
MAKASWEQDVENEEQYQQSLIAEKRAGYARMSPRKAVVAELKNVLPGKLHVRHIYARNKPAELNWKQEKLFRQMKAFNKTLKGHNAVANVIAGRRLNAVPAGRVGAQTVKSMRAVSKAGLAAKLPDNVQNVIAQMLVGPRRRGQLPIMQRMGSTRRGRSVTRRVNEARARRVASIERREKEMRHLGPRRERPSKTRSASAGRRSKSKSRSRSRSVRSA